MSLKRIQRVGVCTAAISAALGTCTSAAIAQETQPNADTSANHVVVNGLEFNFMPCAWIPRVSGSSKLGPSPLAVDLDNRNDLNLDNSEVAFAMDFSVRQNEQWQIKAGGFGYSNDAHGQFDGTAVFGGLTLNPGDDFSSSIDINSFNLEAGYWMHMVCGPQQTHLLFAPTLGVRYLNVDLTVDQTGIGTADTGGDWACPYIGAEMELRWDSAYMLKFIKQVQISAGTGFGPALGGDGGWMTQLHAELTLMFTRNFGAFFGYKLVDFEVENGDFEFDGGLEGLCIGGVLRF